MAHTVDITENALVVNGVSTPLNQVLVAGAQTLEALPRTAFILVTCLFAPIVGMIVATVLDGPGMDAIRWGLGYGLLFGAPIAGGLISVAWKKPWGVTVEIADRGYKALYTNSKDDAEALAARINDAIN